MMNIFQHNKGSSDSGIFSTQKKKRSLPLSRDIILFLLILIGLGILYFVAQVWYDRSQERLGLTSQQYEEVFTSIQNEDFHKAALFVSKSRVLVAILDSSHSFIPIVERFRESIHRDVVLEDIRVQVEPTQVHNEGDGTVKERIEVHIQIKANAYDVSSLGQQYLVWRDRSPWVESVTLDSMAIEDETQRVNFSATIISVLSTTLNENSGEQQ